MEFRFSKMPINSIFSVFPTRTGECMYNFWNVGRWHSWDILFAWQFISIFFFMSSLKMVVIQFLLNLYYTFHCHLLAIFQNFEFHRRKWRNFRIKIQLAHNTRAKKCVFMSWKFFCRMSNVLRIILTAAYIRKWKMSRKFLNRYFIEKLVVV